MTRPVDALARRCGIEPFYEGPDGRPVDVPEETLRHFLEVLGSDRGPAPPTGPNGAAAAADLVAGSNCHSPAWLSRRPAWGIAAQLYELRSRRNWGIGDFADLAALCRIAAGAGADFVGLNPLHAPFLAEPGRCSPYAPSNRRFLNPLYIAVDRLAGFDPAMAQEREIARLREEDFVDYDGVAAAKLRVLREVRKRRGETDAAELAHFRRRAGPALERHALFEALSTRMKRDGHGSGWKDWPDGFQRADLAAVAAFAAANRQEIDFHAWLQWLARRQLDEASLEARRAGMRIGLYLDLAVGEAPDGSASWSDPDLVVGGISIGAPPDVFSAKGQNWGLSPLSPRRLASDGCRAYRLLMEAVMEGAGALRIDHAMALRRLFWIPESRDADAGGFVTYPMRDLLEILAETSRRNGTIIVGEDLGHVPRGFRETMADARILSCRILYFERDGSGFRRADAWPALALACLSTHDLPTLRGWWAGSDIALRLEHGLIDEDSAGQAERAREAERSDLLGALSANGLLAGDMSRDFATRPHCVPPALPVAAHRFVARTPSRLASMRLADAVGEEHPTNLPGVAGGYPNWRRKLAVPVEDLPALPLFQAIASAFARERPR